MPTSRLIVFSACLGALFSFSNCAAPTSSTGTAGASGSSGPGAAGSTGAGGDAAGAAGVTGSGGNSSGSAGNSGPGTGGSVSSHGGTTGSGGTATGTGGNSSGSAGNGSGGSTGTGGTVSSRGGTTGSAGNTAGAAGSSGTGGSSSSRGGTTGSAGSSGSSGSSGSTGTGGTAPVADACGVQIAKAGDSTSSPTSGTVNGIAHCTGYLNLGDMRLINNRWGSDARGTACNPATQESVAVNSDRTFGWTFNRGTCGGSRGDPDFPEVEFGVAPFGTGSSSLTSPPFSSTTLLPIQISALNSASLTFNNFTTSITSNQSTSYWDHNFEFWISKLDPTKNANAQVYAEIIIFLGWEPGRQNSSSTPTPGWTCSVPTAVSQGNFSLCHQSDSWGSGWRFFNFVDSSNSSGGLPSYNQKVDIKAILNAIVAKYSGFTSDMWLTRIEVGTEVDDNTAGSVKISNLTFEINGVSKSAQIQ